MSNLMVKNFYGEIAGRNIYSFLAELDYDLKTSAERIEHLKKVLSDDKGNVHPFFERIFEQTHDDKTKLNTSYIKLILNSTDGLYSETNVCEVITKLTDYVLFSEDMRALERDSKTEYKIYKDAQLFKKTMKEISLEAELEKLGGVEDGDKDIDGLIHILVKEKNSRKGTDQRIYASDLEGEECGEILTLYNNQLEKMSERLKIVKSDMDICSNIIDYKGNKDDIEYQIMCQTVSCFTKEEAGSKRVTLSREMKMLVKHIALIKMDMIDVKELIKRPIRFKHLLNGSTEPNWGDGSAIGEIEVIRECLRFPEKELYDFQNDMDIYLYTVNEMLKKTELTVEEHLVLYLTQEGCNQEYIANECSEKFGEEYNQSEISKCLTNIAKKVNKTYIEYLKLRAIEFNQVSSSDVKKCSKCGELKMRNDFSKDKSKSDGLKSACKSCLKKVGGC